MPALWDTVSVFISSTFRDMHAERDHLVRKVFPVLRQRLEAHRLYLEDIDLRWGVTQEQAENNLVVEFCLQQVEACRPFFVGLLGDRYGWRPTQLPLGSRRLPHGYAALVKQIEPIVVQIKQQFKESEGHE